MDSGSQATTKEIGAHTLLQQQIWLPATLIDRGCGIVAPSRDCWRKFVTGILVHNSKAIKRRVKVQAWGQNDWSRALKWGNVHICSSNIFGDTTKLMKMWVFQFLHFCKKVLISLDKNAKNAKTWKMILFIFNHISINFWVTETYCTSF